MLATPMSAAAVVASCSCSCNCCCCCCPYSYFRYFVWAADAAFREPQTAPVLNIHPALLLLTVSMSYIVVVRLGDHVGDKDDDDKSRWRRQVAMTTSKMSKMTYHNTAVAATRRSQHDEIVDHIETTAISNASADLSQLLLLPLPLPLLPLLHLLPLLLLSLPLLLSALLLLLLLMLLLLPMLQLMLI